MGDDAVAEFKHGIQLLREGYPADAQRRFHRAVELESDNAYYLSFLGVSEARGLKNLAAATDLCKAAVNLKRDEAQFYLNLAEVYLAAGRRDDAIGVLDKGLIYLAADLRIRRARTRLGMRQTAVLPFLDRGHFLNRSLGKLRHRVMSRLHKPAYSN